MASARFRAWLIPLLAVLLAVTSGCFGGGHAVGDPETGAVPTGRSSQVIEWGGISRKFDLYRPQGLTGPAPLVVMMHGGFGNSAQAERSYHWDAQADTGHILVMYPDGHHRAWNAGTCCGMPQQDNIDDVGFITAAVAALGRRIPIDQSRIYATGMSNGAMMALRLACETDAFAAIAPVAGTLVTDCSHARPTSVLQIHGIDDHSVPYPGGPGKALKANGTPRVNGPPIPTVAATWRAIDGCGPPTSTTAGVVTTETADCPNGRAVQLISVAGAGHQWPGSERGPLAELLGASEPSTALDATDTIWRFFSQHRR